jgi:hypothetical protein
MEAQTTHHHPPPKPEAAPNQDAAPTEPSSPVTPDTNGQPYWECDRVDEHFFHNAPQRYVFERELETTPEKLWEIFEDPHSWTVFGGPGITNVEWTSPKPFGVGTQRTVTFVGGMQVFEYFSAWEPGKHMSFYFLGATQAVWWAFGEDYQITDLGNGRCLWRWTVAYDPRGVLRAIHPIARPGMALILGKNIADGLVRYVKKLNDSNR